jgi:hypothetical protein
MRRNRSPSDSRARPEVDDAVRATARLPSLDIEIVRSSASDDDAETITIHLRAAPVFGAFARAFGTTNPLTVWVRAVELAWQPWLGAARVLALPWMPELPSLEEGTTDAKGDGTTARLSRPRHGVIPDIQ